MLSFTFIVFGVLIV